MTNTLALSWQPSGKSRWRSRLRWGTFLLGTACIFSLGFYCWPLPIRGYVARVKLALSTNPPSVAVDSLWSTAAQAQVRDEALSVETVRAALDLAGPPSGTRGQNSAFPTAAEIEQVRQNVQIVPSASATAAEAALDLQYTGQDSEWSLALVEGLARVTLARLNDRADKSTTVSGDVVVDRLALAERYEQSARAALDDFLNRHFDEFNRLAKTSQQVQQPGSRPTDANRAISESVNVEPKFNPKWQSLVEQISAATAELDRILLDRTGEHPQAKEAAIKVEALQRQLESTPKYQNGDPTARRGSVPHRAGSAVQPIQFSQAESGVDSDLPHRAYGAGNEYERLLAELRRAREERHAALRENSQSPRRVTPVLTVVRGKVVANAHLAQTLREAPSAGRLTVLALISILSGASLAALIRNPRASRVYATVAEIESDLSLPVVGVLPAPILPAAALSR